MIAAGKKITSFPENPHWRYISGCKMAANTVRS